MSSTAAKVCNFADLKNKGINLYGVHKKKVLEKLTDKEMRQSMDFRNRNRERD